MKPCPKCIRGECKRDEQLDVVGKEAYVCTNCGFVLQTNKPSNLPTVFFYVERTGEMPPDMKKRLLDLNIKIIKVPTDIKTWSPKVQANVEAYAVFNELVKHPQVLAFDEFKHVINPKEIVKILTKEI